jgi:MoaA/NifB/PqqE/SkfB family radical SAM enzyme
MNDIDLTSYMSSVADDLVKDVVRSSLTDPKELAFLLRFRRSVKAANAIREGYEHEGTHVPAFLISSITTSCNLFCKGCYARANGICGKPLKTEMSSDDWRSVFAQAEDLGISFNILAGGEPLMRRDVIEAASAMENTVFPVFTNGTLIDGRYMEMFREHRHMIPVLSLEGDRERTDARRGEGTYDGVMSKMSELKANKLFFGLSVTVTKENQEEVLSDGFLNGISERGCRILFLIEFVPADRSLAHLAPDDSSRELFGKRLEEVRRSGHRMMIMSFPGDEVRLGGCIGAGRGFFHINPYGDAEACPASPYSDINLMNSTLKDVLSSPLFAEIRARGMMEGEHKGGCILIEKEAEIARLL